MRALLEAFSGKRLQDMLVSNHTTMPATTPTTPTSPTAKPFTQGEFDELCGMFGVPDNIELLLKSAPSAGPPA